MSTFIKQLLSASSNGAPIKVTGTATGSSSLLHTAHSSDKDVVWLYAVNTGVGNVTLTIEFGSAAAPDHQIKKIIPANSGPVLVVPGIPVSGGVQIRAFASMANLINVVGHVDRVSQASGSSLTQPVPFDTKAVRFHNQTDERLNGGAVAEVSFDNDEPFSVVFWFRITAEELDGVTGYMVANYALSGQWYVYLLEGDYLRFYLNDGTTSLIVDLSDNEYYKEFRDSEWHMCTCVYDGAGGAAVYVDNTLGDTNSTTMAGSGTMGGTTFRVGDRAQATGTPFEGLIGPVTIYSVELSASDVAELYNEGTTVDPRTGPESASIQGYWRMGEGDTGTTIVDWSSNNNDLTMVGLTVVDDVEDSGNFVEGYVATPHTPGLKSVEFDSTGGQVLENTALSMPYGLWMAIQRPITVAFWMRSTGAQADNAELFFYGDDSATEGITIYKKSATDAFYHKLSTSGTLDWLRTCNNGKLNADVGWMLHVFVFNGDLHDDLRQYYCNGQQYRVTGSGTDTLGEIGEPTDVLIGSSGINAKMCHVSLWQRALSKSEIRKLYNNGIPTDVVADFPEALLHHWPLGDHPSDAYPTLIDVVSGQNLTMTTMSSANIVTDHPANPT